MPDPTIPTPAQPTPAVIPAADPILPAPPAAASDSTSTAPILPQGKNVTLPTRAFKERLDQATKAGRAAYRAELDKEAQARGFANHESMLQHLDSLRTTTQQSTTTPPARNGRQGQQPPRGQQAQPRQPDQQQQQPRPTRQDHRALREAEQLRRENAKLSKQNRMLKRQADAEAARTQLSRIAMNVGVKDVDYAITLYERAQSGKSPEEQALMDEAKFFSGLRKTHPLLFNEVEVLATTGTSGEVPGSTPAPTPAAASGQLARTNGSTSAGAMGMSKTEFHRHMRSMGVRGFATGLG